MRGGTPDTRTHYEVLGVNVDATASEIKAAYRRRVMEVHPDLGRGLAGREAAAELALLQLARSVLGDPARRADYDEAFGLRAPTGVAEWVPPPVPPGFELHRSGFYGQWPVAGSDAKLRIADAVQKALSLRAVQPRLRPLRALAPDSLWLLDGHGQPITDVDVEELLAMRRLRRLELADSAITDEGLRSVGRITSLDALGLWGTKVSDAGLVHLAGLVNLDLLVLAETAVTDEGLRHLVPLRELDRVDLRGTAVRGPGLGYLAEIEDLNEVILPGKVDRRALKEFTARRPDVVII